MLSHAQEPVQYQPEAMSNYLQQEHAMGQLEAQVSEAPCLAMEDTQFQIARKRNRRRASELWIYLGLAAAIGMIVAFLGWGGAPTNGSPTLPVETLISKTEVQEFCFSDMTPCFHGISCCGRCVDGMVGGLPTGMCAGNGSWDNSGASQCLPANASCSADMDCCGVCKDEGQAGQPKRRGVGTCAVQDTWSRKCLPRGEGCSDELACCGHCVYEGADTRICCDNPKIVSNGSWAVCCDDTGAFNSHWCSS